MSSHRVDVPIFAVAFAITGLVALAIVWSGDWAYAALARRSGVERAVLRWDGPNGPVQEEAFTLDRLLELHHEWVAYVNGFRTDPPVPRQPPDRTLFVDSEYEHMRDVRGVFRGAMTLAILTLGVMAFRLSRAHRRSDMLYLVRDGAIGALALVLAVGLAALVAFDALFLLFHEVLFPQGNFLFDPATSDIIRLYPEWYWQGITAAVALSFIAVALVVAGAAHIALRRGANTYTRAA